ncbi:hypothetical protein BDFB_013130 [Asbolus verrucosus]|uniref:Uncharacterized protein n=1 Tax=Asbolus verrucosus TaxID=1661398 RepID=A0A482VI82_ASBVE|nr:hypothetical protein BDFB_013130 [Asbolus verrucosus]
MKNEAQHFHENNVTSFPVANYKQRVTAATGISEENVQNNCKRGEGREH